MRVVLDIEADGLIPTQIWCVVTKDIDTDEVRVFTDRVSCREFFDSATIDLIISHNGIDYDWLYLHTLWGIFIPPSKCRDTLVLSRLLNQKMDGGHSLEAWGERLGFKKTEFDDFSKLTQEMIDYCINDVHLNHRLYVYLESKMRFPNWRKSVQLEHDIAFLCRDMHYRGFSFNQKRALELLDEIEGIITDLDNQILEEFKPIKTEVRRYRLKKTKDGNWSKKTAELLKDPDVELVGAELVRFTQKKFNPQSSKQVCERLQGYWTPYEKTDAHKEALSNKDKEKLEYFKVYGWKTTEANLSTISDDAPKSAKLLVKRIMFGSRQRTLKTWLEAYNEDTGKIHARFNPLGTWTHRFSHTDPNLGNVSAEKSIKYKGEEIRKLAIHYGGEFRKLFTASPGYKLVGVDMEGAHLRLFASFIDDKELIKALISGDKKLGTDAHSLNKKKLGDLCPDRDLAKTFIFLYLNGGAAPKVAEIFQCPIPRAKTVLDDFIRSYPGLAQLKRDKIPADAKRGFFVGLDGRKVPCDSEHLMVAGYLQNGEAVVVKTVAIRAIEHFRSKGWDVHIVNIVHDEIQFEVPDNEEMIKYVQEYTCDLFKTVGEELKLSCPLGGEASVGDNWLESH